MALVASANNWQADHMVDHPGPILAVEMRPLGAANVRMLFHFQAAEENRRNYEIWEIAQIGLALLFFLFLLFGTTESKPAILGALAMLGLVLIQRLFLTPDIASIGRVVDFLPPDVPSDLRAKTIVLVGFYGGVECAKWLIQLWMVGRLILGGRRSPSEGFRNYVNPIDKANYRHINR